MREMVREQLPLVQAPIVHPHAQELAVISELLDTTPGLWELVHEDLLRGGVNPDVGRGGMGADTVLRALLIKQMSEYSYEQLAYHLLDSRTYRHFCRMGEFEGVPKKSTLQANFKKLRPETMQRISQLVLNRAMEEGIETGRRVRVDCTVTETNIHQPTDNSLLWDCVRVLTRLLGDLNELLGSNARVAFSDHTRQAKRRHLEVMNAKTERERQRAYKDLLKIARRTLGYAEAAVEVVAGLSLHPSLTACAVAAEIRKYIELTHKVIDQTHRRVVLGETVPVKDKVLSIFEPHTDLIVKGGRDHELGHKICLTGGASSLVLDCIITKGNPADSTLAAEMIRRQEAIYGRVPRQAAFDGGFASNDNLAQNQLPPAERVV